MNQPTPPEMMRNVFVITFYNEGTMSMGWREDVTIPLGSRPVLFRDSDHSSDDKLLSGQNPPRILVVMLMQTVTGQKFHCIGRDFGTQYYREDSFEWQEEITKRKLGALDTAT